MKSHLISQVLLRRFAINNKVSVTNLKTLLNTNTIPEKIGYLELPYQEFKKIEQKWGITEQKIYQAFIKVDQGTILQSPNDLITVKKLMGLHYLRSNAYFIKLSETEPMIFYSYIKDILKDHPDKKAEIIREIHAIRENWLQRLKRVVVQSLRSVSKKVDGYISKFDIEIGITSNNVSLLLSDNPAINLSSVDGRMGILSGLTIDESDSFSLPLGPRHIAALITKNNNTNYKILTDNEVGSINAKSIKQSINEFYSTPLIKRRY